MSVNTTAISKFVSFGDGEVTQSKLAIKLYIYSNSQVRALSKLKRP